MNRRTFGFGVGRRLASSLLASVAISLFLPLAAGAQGSALSVPAAIPADCSVDATAALNEFLADAPDGSVVAFPAGGCYLVIGTVEINGKTDFTIEGNGTRLVRTELSPQALRWPNRNAYVRIANGNRVFLSGLHVEGTNNGNDFGGTVADANGNSRSVTCLSYLSDYGCYTIALEFEHAFEVLGSVDTEVADVSARDVWGDGVYVAGHDQFTNQQGERVTLRDITIDRNGRQGIAVNRIRHVLIDGMNLSRGRRSGIDLEPDTGNELISDVEIRNSTIETNLLAFASYGRGEASNVYIHDNVVTRTGVPWVYVRANDGTQRFNWRIHNNDVQHALGSPQPGLMFENVLNVEVIGNTNHYAPAQPTDAVGLMNGSTAYVACNWFEDANSVVVDRGGAGSWSEENNSTGSTSPGACSDSGEPDPGTAPDAPSSLQSTGFPDPRVDLSWTDNSNNEDAFELLRRGPGEASFSFLAYLGADATSHQDYDVVAGEEYCYQVLAHNAVGGSSPSNTACATPGSAPQPPASPTNLQADSTTSPTVDVSWSDVSADEDLFEVERKGPGDSSFWPIGSVNANVEAFADGGVEGGLEYCYQVIAVNANGRSEPSNMSCATAMSPEPAPVPLPPADPEQLEAYSQADQKVNELVWVDASDNELEFEVHRMQSNQRKYIRIASLEADATSYTDTRVRVGELYCYVVIARNDLGSSISNEACVVAGTAGQ